MREKKSSVMDWINLWDFFFSWNSQFGVWIAFFCTVTHKFSFLFRDFIISLRAKTPALHLWWNTIHLQHFHPFAKSLFSTLVYDLDIATTSNILTWMFYRQLATQSMYSRTCLLSLKSAPASPGSCCHAHGIFVFQSPLFTTSTAPVSSFSHLFPTVFNVRS